MKEKESIEKNILLQTLGKVTYRGTNFVCTLCHLLYYKRQFKKEQKEENAAPDETLG